MLEVFGGRPGDHLDWDEPTVGVGLFHDLRRRLGVGELSGFGFHPSDDRLTVAVLPQPAAANL